MRDVLARRRGREDDADLLGTLAIAVLLVLLPLATSDAHPLAGLVGGVDGHRARARPRPPARALMAGDGPFSDAEIEAAVQAMSEPGRLDEAQRVVATAAPQLQRILDEALEAAEWYGSAHQAAVLEASGKPDVDERLGAVQRLIVEETRVSMLIGVAVGYELARTLSDPKD